MIERFKPVRFVYVTTMLPYGAKEAFFIPEIRELRTQGHEVVVVPMRKPGPVQHDDATEIEALTEYRSLWGLSVLTAFLAELVTRPVRTIAAAVALVRASRNATVLAKNLAVIPKGAWLGRVARRRRAQHIHAQWAGATASLAFVAHRVSGIAWSFTAHRWDIPENNALALKAQAATAVRAIDLRGASELRTFCGPHSGKVRVIHMGVVVPAQTITPAANGDALKVVVAANLVEKKGHRFLIDAVGELERTGVRVQVDFAGDGPLRDALHGQVKTGGITGVRFLGVVSHAELLERLLRRDWDLMALPSIVTDDGEKEGIPVSLIEAMACGVPVLSTSTGGIPELLGGGAGVIVPERDSRALASALESLYRDPARRTELSRSGAAKVAAEFAVSSAMRDFVELVERSSERGVEAA
jgi:colanic acid/amylovoran biosynthesis glycosyltransferase